MVMDRTQTNCEYVDSIDYKLYNMTDTVVYKFNGFVQYRPILKPVNISKIAYYYYVSTDITDYNGYDCIEINRSGRCFLHYLNAPNERYFEGVLDSSMLDELWKMVSYVDIKSKKESYREESDHGSGAKFVIYFDDGTVKKIETWCNCEMELSYVSKKIAEISAMRTLWKSSGPYPSFECPCQ